jgi:HD superfamily phosphohydrolase
VISFLNLEKEIDTFVTEVFERWQGRKITTEKIINDPIHGAGTFSPYEIHIMDTPFVQRLRHIRQTGMSYLVYPTATHTRFEHSLGVAILSNKVWRALRSKDSSALVNEITLRELRLASILHDIGHGPFSHASEEIIEELPEIQSEIKREDGKFSKCKPHEVLSYHIVTSNRFIDFLKDEIIKGYKQDFEIENVANMIIGQMDDPSLDQWKSDIINGTFDADKLDYMLRDSYFSGVRMEIDLDRVMFALEIDDRDDKNRKIIARLAGVHSLEQIMFNKLLLYSTIYHHHAIRAIECMIKTVFELLLDENLTINGKNINTAVDFLRMTDRDLFNEKQDNAEISKISYNLRNRIIYRRAGVLCLQSVKTRNQFNELTRLSEDRHSIKIVRSAINSYMGREDPAFHEIWIDLPDNPSVREPPMCDVKIAPDYYSDIDELFPLSGWLTAYAENKWRGHIFTYDHLRNDTYDASKEVLKGLHDIELDDKISKHLAKIKG